MRSWQLREGEYRTYRVNGEASLPLSTIF